MDRSAAGAWLAAHAAGDADQREFAAQVMALLADTPAPFGRSQVDPGHVTASAFVVSPAGDALLLVHHKALDMWLQPGGHVEPGDRDLLAAARREVAEETGLTDLALLPGRPWLVDVDVHEIPARPNKGEGPHRHFDVRLAFQAATRALRTNDEVHDARWVPWDEVATTATDASVRRVARQLRAWSEPGPAARRHAPAAERNHGVIGAELARRVPAGARLLELGCGSGQHAAWLRSTLPVDQWVSAELDDGGLLSARAWSPPPAPAPRRIDLATPPWPAVQGETYDVAFCANVIHIAPWAVACGLFEGTAAVVRPGGQLALYGPFRMGGRHTAPSNEAFDASLRGRDPTWGVRDIEAVVAEAGRWGWRWEETVAVPANNAVVWFRREGSAPDVDAVLEDWFGVALPSDNAHRRAWFASFDSRDAELRSRFGALHEQAVSGALDHWASTPRGLVALILLLDQHSRQIHRGTPGMFAADARALAWSRHAVARGWHREMPWEHRLFTLMPLMHAEDATVQQLSVMCFRDLAADALAGGDERYAMNIDFAERHRAIVQRFGRYPHRNEVLGRVSSAEEEAFLLEPGSSF